MKEHVLHSKKILRPFRNTLRKKSTSAETAFWNLVKNRKFEGRKFRRQHSIGNYIVDFYCPSNKLIVELDGDSHGDYSRISEDITRDNFLQSKGYTILRFENRFVFQDPEYILKQIAGKLINHPGPDLPSEQKLIFGRATPR